MRSSIYLVLSFVLIACAQAQVPSPEVQIAGALSAAPDHLVAAASVLGYDADGAVVTLREGSNELVCLADQPGNEQFSAACYHASLEPFMARGRALRAEGKSRGDVQQMRRDEIASGELAFPMEPTTLYIRYGPLADLDTEAGNYADLKLRYVIYTPYATAESTGLPTSAVPGAPWLMNAGEPWAHIMILPQ